MVRIIKAGTRKITTCDNCGCKFSYEDEDVIDGGTYKINKDSCVVFNNESPYVVCPQCSNKIVLMQTR